MFSSRISNRLRVWPITTFTAAVTLAKSRTRTKISNSARLHKTTVQGSKLHTLGYQVERENIFWNYGLVGYLRSLNKQDCLLAFGRRRASIAPTRSGHRRSPNTALRKAVVSLGLRFQVRGINMKTTIVALIKSVLLGLAVLVIVGAGQ